MRKKKGAREELIWLRPEPGDRKTRLSRAKIAEAALAIADAEGFDAVTMRRIADRLGTGAMTLYHYIRTKADLIALMDDALMGEIVVPEAELPRDWRAAIHAIARRTRDVFLRHPWALVSMLGAPPGPNAMRHFEQELAVLEAAPLDDEQRLELLKFADDFVFGYALRTGEVLAWGGPDSPLGRSVEAFGQQQRATGAFPRTTALLARSDPQDAQNYVSWLTDDRRFDRGLTALLDGFVRLAPDRKLRFRSRARRRPAKRRG